MTADRDYRRLYPEFRAALVATLKDARKETGHPWGLVEGWRSGARQQYLWGQGRTRPGALCVSSRAPGTHGAGLAADVMPARHGGPGQGTKNTPWPDPPHAFWQALKAAGRRHGLLNPCWHAGERGHLQWADDRLLYVAQAWVRLQWPLRWEFSPPAIAVVMRSCLIPDAGATTSSTPSGPRHFVWARAVLEAAGYVTPRVTPQAWWVLPGRAQRRREPIPLPVSQLAGRAIVATEALGRRLRWHVTWDAAAQRLTLAPPHTREEE